MTPDQAADLATRTLAAIGDREDWVNPDWQDYFRERVASDLAGLQQHSERMSDDNPGWCAEDMHADWPCPDAARYADNLRRTAILYGVQT